MYPIVSESSGHHVLLTFGVRDTLPYNIMCSTGNVMLAADDNKLQHLAKDAMVNEASFYLAMCKLNWI